VNKILQLWVLLEILLTFSIAGVNNVDLQIAIQFAAGGSASASSGAVTLYFE
jgi:hypothetical protein